MNPYRTLFSVGVLVLAGGCSSTRPATPYELVIDSKVQPEQRAAAVAKAWAGAASPAEKATLRNELETLVWSPKAPVELRLAIIDTLLADTDETSRKQTHDLLKLVLPRVQNRGVVARICKAAIERSWTDYIPAIVRAYAVAVPGVPDEQRAEREAIRKLAGDRPQERVVFEVFVNPPKEGSTWGVNWEEKFRADAWEVLCRLDPTGATRGALVRDAVASGTKDEVLLTLDRAERELRCVPTTGSEFEWLRRLADPKNAGNRVWWDQASKAVAGLGGEPMQKFAMRHLEAVRWASQAKPEWVNASRDQLLTIIGERVKDRTVNIRTAERGRGLPDITERFDKARDRMAWGDALALLVADEAIQQPGVVRSLFNYAKFDAEDTTTEYGGILESDGTPTGFRAILYPPRMAQRIGDDRFVASDDMMLAGDQSLAHYHFHVKERRNGEFAGPSPVDLDYATTLGRTCLVLTSLGEGKLGVDYYQPGSVVVDLGEIHAAPER